MPVFQLREAITLSDYVLVLYVLVYFKDNCRGYLAYLYYNYFETKWLSTKCSLSFIGEQDYLDLIRKQTETCHYCS